MTVTVIIPTMLAQLIGGSRTHRVEGATVREAIETLLDRFPGLRVHLFAEDRTLRPHLRCFLDGTMVSELSTAARDEGTITLLQAVSGGTGPLVVACAP